MKLKKLSDKHLKSTIETLEYDHIRTHLASFTVSQTGKELVEKLKPLTDTALIREYLSQTTELRDLVDYDQAPPISSIPDVRAILKKVKIVGSILFIEECVAVAQFLATVRACHNFFNAKDEKIKTLKKVTRRLLPIQALEKKILACIDTSSLEIKNNASPELSKIRSQMERARGSARKKIEQMLKSYSSQGMLQENVVSFRNGRMVLVVKDEYKRKIKGLIHDRSSSGASVFLEPLNVLEDNNRLRELEIAEHKEIEKILFELTNHIREEMSAIEKNVDTLARLDFINAKAYFSRALNAFQPEISDDHIIDICDGRHPLLILRMGEQQVVPLDVKLDNETHTLIISGPNAGGKTVALKTIGLLMMMARSGLHVPLQPHSKIGNINNFFANIGDQQSLDNDLSTFSSHLAGLIEIIEHVDEQSLVLIDEIGSGTDPEEGTALAMALLERLNTLGCFSIVTTHQSPLKAFAYRTPGVENASLEFDVKTLESTFHFRVGIPGSSYAFEIAERMGLPVEILERSREFIGSAKDKLEGLILELDEKVQDYSKRAKAAEYNERQYKELLSKYNEKFKKLKDEKNQIKRQAVLEAEQLLADSNAAVEAAIREIKEAQAEKAAIKNAKGKLLAQRDNIAKHKVETEQPIVKSEPGNIQNGDRVMWLQNKSQGQVLSEPDKKGKVLVQMDGGVKIALPLDQLSKIKKKKQRSTVVMHVEQPKNLSNEIDLRGMLSEDAIFAVDKFIDESLMLGLSEISLIHGKGTGALRASITEHLKGHPLIAGSRMGNWNEGDAGVTVVKLSKK